jgi:hypothetical protein
MLTDKVVLQVLGVGLLTATETVLTNIPRKTYQSLVVVVKLAAPEAGTLQLLVKNDPVGAAVNAPTQGLRVHVRKQTLAGASPVLDTVLSDVTGMVTVPFTDSFTAEMSLPEMLMARSDAFSVGLKTAIAPTGAANFVALLVQSRA